MIVKYRFDIRDIFEISKENIAFSLVMVFIAVILKVTNYYNDWGVPVSVTAVLGTALSILLGFSNSQAYERWWEARKIWGAIVNDSRSFTKQLLMFVSSNSNESIIKPIQKEIVYRHLAYINALKLQLREEKSTTKWAAELTPFLSEDEFNSISEKKNSATQLIKNQTLVIKRLYNDGHINDFQLVEIDKMLSNFYTYQGQAERIKTTPFLPTYHFFSRVFVYFFIALLPFSLLSSVDVATTAWMLLPITVIIGWIFHMIYLNGNVYAYPFSNNRFDTPMSAICNTIEIDLKQMIDDDTVPEKVATINGILM